MKKKKILKVLILFPFISAALGGILFALGTTGISFWRYWLAGAMILALISIVMIVLFGLAYLSHSSEQD